MPTLQPYNRQAAVAYAHRWAFGRNPAYSNFDGMGGDCTNFASQCLYAGTGIMNFTPTYGWYYLSLNDRAPAWTGVEFFYRFLTRGEDSPGPAAVETSLSNCLPGDFAQLNFGAGVYGHTPIIVAMGNPPTLNNTLIAAHTYDADYRPLSSYTFRAVRFLHIIGAWRE